MDEWNRMDSRLPVAIPADDEIIPFLQTSAPFIDFSHPDPPPEGSPVLLIPYDTLLRLGSHGYRLKDPLLRQASALDTSILPISIISNLRVHLRDGFPRDCIFDSWAMWHEALLQHTLTMLLTDKSEDYDLSYRDIFAHQRYEPGQDVGWRWLSYISHNNCCNDLDIPILHDFIHSVARSFKVNDKLDERGPFRYTWSAVRSLLGRHDDLLKHDADADDSPTAGKVVMELIQKTTNHLALGCLDSGPSSHSVLMKVKEQAELLFGQTFAKQRIMMDNFQRLICSSRVFLQRVLEEGELLEEATSYEFTAITEQEFPRVFLNFAGVNDSQESFIKLSEEAGSIFHGSPTSLRNVEQLLGEHIGTLNPPEIAMSPIADKVSLILRKNAAANSAQPISSNAGAGTQAPISSYGKSSLELVLRCTLDTSFAVHAERIFHMQGEESDSMWMFKILLDTLAFRQPSVEGDDRHPLFSQTIWGQRKLSSQVHPVFPTLIRVRENKDEFLARYLYFGESLGVEGAWHMKCFLLPTSFTNKFWRGQWKDIHWWNELILPFLNAERKIGKDPPVPQGQVYITVDRMMHFHRFLEPLAVIMGTDPEGHFSMKAFLQKLTELQLKARLMGEGKFHSSMMQHVQSIFDRTMAAICSHIVTPLLSDDPHAAISEQLIPCTAMGISDFMGKCVQSIESMSNLAEMCPEFFDTMNEGITPQTALTVTFLGHIIMGFDKVIDLHLSTNDARLADAYTTVYTARTQGYIAWPNPQRSQATNRYNGLPAMTVTCHTMLSFSRKLKCITLLRQMNGRDVWNPPCLWTRLTCYQPSNTPPPPQVDTSRSIQIALGPTPKGLTQVNALLH